MRNIAIRMTREQFAKKLKGARLPGLQFEGNAGHFSMGGVKAAFEYSDCQQTLTITIASKPDYLPLDLIAVRIAKTVSGA